MKKNKKRNNYTQKFFDISDDTKDIEISKNLLSISAFNIRNIYIFNERFDFIIIHFGAFNSCGSTNTLYGSEGF